MASNVKLKTNVVCEELCDEDGRIIARASVDDLASRLSYFELNGLHRAMPYIFSSRLWQDNRLSPQQKIQRDAFLREGEDPVYFSVEKSAIPRAELKLNPFFIADRSGVPETPDPPDEVEARDREDLPKEPVALPEKPVIEEPDEQDLVLQLPVTHSALVIAPPGTGKTHLLIEKLAKVLSGNKFDNPADEILVLSFTRAAVREIKSRLVEKASGVKTGDFDLLGVRTFDSFAGYMLTYDPEMGFGAGGYDETISALCKVIEDESSEVIAEKISALKFLVVDEIQDLSKDRARLVLLLSRKIIGSGGACLMLGDPCQAIYDWDVKESKGELSSQQFLTELRSMIESHDYGAVHALHKYYRYTNPKTLAFVSAARAAMGEMGDMPAGGELISMLYQNSGPVALADLSEKLDLGTRTAILGRKNIDVHDIFEWLSLRDFPAYSDEGAAGEGWPAWLSIALSGWESQTMSIGRFEERVRQKFSQVDLAAPNWETVIDEADFRALESESLDLLKVFESVRSARPPPIERQNARITVSTVHKSKGLEFDNVLLVEPDTNAAGTPEEVRIAYVAATRAKNTFQLLQRDKNVFRGIRKGFRKNPATGNEQYFFDGATSFDMASLVFESVIGSDVRRSETFRIRQGALWSRWICKDLSAFGRTVMVGEKRRIGVYMCSKEAQSDEVLIGFLSPDTEYLIHKKLRILRDDRVYIPDLPVRRLESFAFPVWSDEMARILGEAGLVCAPVIQGFGELIPLGEGA